MKRNNSYSINQHCPYLQFYFQYSKGMFFSISLVIIKVLFLILFESSIKFFNILLQVWEQDSCNSETISKQRNNILCTAPYFPVFTFWIVTGLLCKIILGGQQLIIHHENQLFSEKKNPNQLFRRMNPVFKNNIFLFIHCTLYFMTIKVLLFRNTA